jgi:hypothetical protein
VGLVADDAINDVGADLLELGCPADVGFFVETGHELDDDGDFLAVLGGADQRFHEDRVGAGAVHRHLDGDHGGVGGRLAQEFDDRGERLVGVVEQDVGLADGVENIDAFADDLGQARHEGAEFHVRAIDPVRHLHQANQVHRAIDAVKVGGLEFKLGEQEFGHRLRAVVGDFETHGVAEVALRQFALQLGAQVGDFFLVDEEVGIARGAELVAAEHGHAGE